MRLTFKWLKVIRELRAHRQVAIVTEKGKGKRGRKRNRKQTFKIKEIVTIG